MAKKKYSDADKDRMVDAVDALRKNEGLNLIDACRKAKVSVSLYQWWRGRREGKYIYKRRPNVDADTLTRSIQTAIGELESGPSQRRALAGNSRMCLIERLYAVKSALMELERELIMDTTRGVDREAE